MSRSGLFSGVVYDGFGDVGVYGVRCSSRDAACVIKSHEAGHPGVKRRSSLLVFVSEPAGVRIRLVSEALKPGESRSAESERLYQGVEVWTVVM